jgi:tetratricopeptide (TPR) repeat protein
MSDILTLLGAFFLGFLAGVALGPVRKLLGGFWNAPGRLTRRAADAGAKLRQAFKIKPGEEGLDRTGLTGTIAGAVSDVLTLGVRRADVAFREGNAAFETGDYELARRRFSEALLWDRGQELKPMHVLAHSRLGWLDEERGELAGAKNHYQQAVRVEPTDLMATVRLGMVHFRLGETGPAIFQFQRALELNPNDLDAHYYLYAIYRQAGMEREAVEQLRLTKMGETPDTLAELFGSHGADNFRLTHYAEAIKDYELALQVAPNSLPLYVALGDLYHLQGQPSTALEVWSRGLYLEYSPALAERVASVATEVGETWPVVTLLRDAAVRHPQDGRYPLLLSRLLGHLGEEDQSLAMIESAVRLSPGLIQAQMELGDRYTTMGQSDRAHLTFREGLRAAWNEGTVFRCRECGYTSAESQERCFQCGRWNLFESMTRSEASMRGVSGRKLLQQAAGVRRSLDSLWHRIAGLLPAGDRPQQAE